jgi:hypothetical protein
MDPDLRDRLAAIGAFADELASTGFDPGRWHPIAPMRDDPSVSSMPWYELSDRGVAFVRALGGLVEPFDWPTWAKTPEAQRLYLDREALAAATPDDLVRLVTAIVRSERFSEGSLDEAFEQGVMLAIAQRCAVLAADVDH